MQRFFLMTQTTRKGAYCPALVPFTQATRWEDRSQRCVARPSSACHWNVGGLSVPMNVRAINHNANILAMCRIYVCVVDYPNLIHRDRI